MIEHQLYLLFSAQPGNSGLRTDEHSGCIPLFQLSIFKGCTCLFFVITLANADKQTILYSGNFFHQMHFEVLIHFNIATSTQALLPALP